MYQIIEKAVQTNSVKEYYELLDDEHCSKWIAHHLIEQVKLPKEIEDKCFSIIETLASEETAYALGERYWLKEWKTKKNRL